MGIVTLKQAILDDSGSFEKVETSERDRQGSGKRVVPPPRSDPEVKAKDDGATSPQGVRSMTRKNFLRWEEFNPGTEKF